MVFYAIILHAVLQKIVWIIRISIVIATQYASIEAIAEKKNMKISYTTSGYTTLQHSFGLWNE